MLKKTLIAAALSLLTIGAVHAAEADLLANGALKGKNTPSGWYCVEKVKGAIKYSPKGGHADLPYVEFTSAEKELSLRCNPKLEKGKNYKLTFWLKSSGKCKVAAAIVTDSGWNKSKGNHKLAQDTKGQWVKQEVLLNGMFDSPKGYQLIFYTIGLEGTFAVSDIALTAAEPAAK